MGVGLLKSSEDRINRHVLQAPGLSINRSRALVVVVVVIVAWTLSLPL